MTLREVKKLMSLSTLPFRRTLAQPPPSTNPLLLNLRRPPPCSVRMSSTQSDNMTDLEPIFKQKKIIRSKVRKSLKEMDPSLRSFEDDAIQCTVLEAPWFKSSKRLCAYISCQALREVDTSKLLAEILQTSAKDDQNCSRKKLYVPRVEDKNSHMRMLHISGLEDLIANSMDILEPAPLDTKGDHREDGIALEFLAYYKCAVMRADEPVDLFLLPGLAFDKSGRRLGRGGGYYDTLLRKYRQLANERNWKQPLLVALSYSVQILDDGVIPITPNDVYIDALVSPAGVIPISSSALHRYHAEH
ncbi:hypothetical protein Cgig2_016486 [Carnegiea gigantea]|uniref:5-formyltetrahydrofolate cyclo-ligase n=1 Tax=Carnegiea gigantea TaxID=171969 RepID=A0A9Q1JKZ0_9CARY|nr:hypothetical protein Cgig2_016486 [Carnegiea gigantea]